MLIVKLETQTRLFIFYVVNYFLSIYDDVPCAFERWVESGRKLYIYSSGSIEAQILLFKNSQAGDLTKVILYKL